MKSVQKKIDEYQLMVFDIDGTLYDQKIMRLCMAVELVIGILCRKGVRKQIPVLRTIRNVREVWDDLAHNHRMMAESDSLEKAQYEYTANQLGVAYEEVEGTIREWMEQRPLKYMWICKDYRLAKKIKEWQKVGIQTAVYSDCPIAGKTKALGLSFVYECSAYDQGVQAMKPNSKGLEVILATLDILPEHAIMMGDRYEKDGLAAKSIGMDYIILPRSCWQRKWNQSSVNW